MAKLSKQEIEEIVERDMPGYKVVQHETPDADERAAERNADQVAPDIDTLREKYLGENENSAAESENPGHEANASPETEADDTGDNADDADDAIIAVQPKEAGDPFDHAARPKSVVVSGKDRRVIGSQG
jgi:hypothetical protein